jgi:hypothetical protein
MKSFVALMFLICFIVAHLMKEIEKVLHLALKKWKYQELKDNHLYIYQKSFVKQCQPHTTPAPSPKIINFCH